MTTTLIERKRWSPISNSASEPCRDCGCRHFVTEVNERRNAVVIRHQRCRHCGLGRMRQQHALAQS